MSWEHEYSGDGKIDANLRKKGGDLEEEKSFQYHVM